MYMIYHYLFHVLLFFAYSFVYFVVCFLLFVQAIKVPLGRTFIADYVWSSGIGGDPQILMITMIVPSNR